jgi:hypothetical protein
MARDGSGNYSLPATFAVANQQASSATVNAIMDDIAQALTDSINKDGSKAFEANQSMGGNKLTNLAVATLAADAARLSQVQAGSVQQATTVGGTADAITLAFTPAIAAYATGMVIRWVSGGANTVVAPTVNVESLGAKTIKKNPGGAALVAGDLGVSGTIHEAVYNGTDFILLDPVINLSSYATTASILGQQTIWVPAGAMTARTTNGAASGSVETSTNKVMLKTLDFDTTTQEFSQFAVQFPKSWDEGTLICQFVWSHPATTTNFGVVWAIEAVAFANDDAADTAFGTAVQVADTGGTTNDIYISDETGALTVAGTPGAEEWVVFQVKRVPADGSDTMAVDARLHGVKIHYTIDAAKDN